MRATISRDWTILICLGWHYTLFDSSETSTAWWAAYCSVFAAVLLPAACLMGACPSRRTATPATTEPLRNSAEQSARAKSRWVTATRHIRHLLRLRRLWAEIGRYLQRPELLTLTQGLDRRGGHLVRTLAADRAIQNRVSRAVQRATRRAQLPTQ